MAGEVLHLTDGTTTVDLYSLEGGIKAQRVAAPLAQAKNDGTWTESALEDGRQLLDYKWGNIVEAYTLDVVGGNTDGAIETVRTLYQLLVRAAEYWRDDWRTGSVWLERRSACSTNTEYAVVYKGSIPELPEVMGDPFEEDALLHDMTLTIEHGEWRDNAPSTHTSYPLAGYANWGGKNYGTVNSAGTVTPSSNAGEVFVANHYKEAQITHIYVYDAAPVGWSGNLQGAALPYNLFPAVPAIGDCLYLGIDSTVGDSGPFWSAVFDIQNTMAAHIVQWEAYTGAGAWTALYMVDSTMPGRGIVGQTQPFVLGGIGSVHWYGLATWTTGNLQALFPGPPAGPNVTGWWVRARLTAAGVGLASQQNRDIYTINWPWVEVDTTAVDGDDRAKLKLTFSEGNGYDRAGHAQDPCWHRAVLGLRSYSRGADFCAFLNAANTQMPPGVTCAAHLGAFTASTTSPAGIMIQWAPAGVATVDVCSWTIANPQADDYLGTFHCFARVRRTGGAATDVRWRLQAKVGNRNVVFAQTDWEYAHVTTAQAIDWHTFTIPGRLPADQATQLVLTIQADVLVAAGTYDIIDLIILPADEWAADLLAPESYTDVGIGYQVHLELDSVTHPKQYISGNAIDISTTPDQLCARYRVLANGPAHFRPETKQRLWTFLMMSISSPIPYTELATTIAAEGQASYWLPRGAS